MDTLKYIQNEVLCRICLKEDLNGVELFSREDTSKQILNKIYACFQIVLNFEEYLPTKICSTCCRELESANNFRIKCATFEERYSIFLSKVKDLSNVDTIDKGMIHFDHKPEIDVDDVTETLDSEFTTGENIQENNSERSDQKPKLSLVKYNASVKKRVIKGGINHRYQCTECPYSTPHSQTLVNHMRRHNGERPYQCHCGKSFTQAASLSAHKKTHSDVKCYTCSTCGKQFKHAFSLKNHSRVHGDGTFACDICHKYLKSSQSLRTHMNRHYNVRNFNCEDCGATFVSASELINHRQRHNMMMTVECHICGYKTHAKKNLIIHLKRHTGEKLYKCDLCSMTAYTQADLRRHQRVHSHEKPYQCPVCTQRFSHSGSLNQHARKVHNLNYRWSESKLKQNSITTVKLEKECSQDLLNYKMKQPS